MNQGNNRVKDAPERGMGSLLGDQLHRIGAPHLAQSVLAACRTLDVPVAVHVALGTDSIHIYPSADGAAIGQATSNDFKLLAGVVREVSDGVCPNIGSAVVPPEVFLKAFTIAQNLGAALHDFVTVNMDMTAHDRPTENVVRRPSPLGKAGYTLLGRHEIMLPLLTRAVVERLAEKREQAAAPLTSSASAPNSVPSRTTGF
jgi:hypothetical protein